MKNVALKLFVAAVLFATTAFVSAKEEVPYTEGPVLELSYIKVKPGMFDAYMEYLSTTWKDLNAELKKSGIIMDAKIYSCQARNPHEADLVLAITYKNMAALDGLEERSSAAMEKFWSTRQKSNEASISRESMREILGSEYVRELGLK